MKRRRHQSLRKHCLRTASKGASARGQSRCFARISSATRNGEQRARDARELDERCSIYPQVCNLHVSWSLLDLIPSEITVKGPVILRAQT
jgi:hypothetical protein